MYKKIIKYDLLRNINKGIGLGDYTLDLSMAQPHGGSSQIKNP
jgi:hypothetical protein